MSKWTEAKLKKEAESDYKECYECGHYPGWTNEKLTSEIIKRWADEYNMTLEEFKKYVNYFMELCS